MTRRTSESQSAPRGRVARSFGQHISTMPTWHKQLLGLALVLTIAGVSAQAYNYVRAKDQPVETSSSSPDAPPGARTFVSGDGTSASEPQAQPKATWSQRLPTWATHLGISFIAGFLIGWIFRAFIKTMVLVTLLGVGVLAALSYFNVINVDFTAARTSYETGLQWVSDQGARLKDVAFTYLPSSWPALVGGFLGMRRKRM